MKRLLVVPVIALLFVSPSISLAQAPVGRGVPAGVDQREGSRVRVMERIQETRERSRELRGEIEVHRQEARSRAEATREDLRERLAQLRDQRKAQVVERVARRLTAVNEKWTTHWLNVLDRLSEVLAKAELRASTQEGQDAVSAAEAAIESAREVLRVQAGKVYEVTFGDETTLGSDIRSIVESLKSDLRSTLAVVQDAREAVGVALRTVAGSGGFENGDQGGLNGQNEQDE